jgi:hypothetical protein
MTVMRNTSRMDKGTGAADADALTTASLKASGWVEEELISVTSC